MPVVGALRFSRRSWIVVFPLHVSCRPLRLFRPLFLCRCVPSVGESAQGNRLFTQERLHDGGGDARRQTSPRRVDPRRIESKQSGKLAPKLHRCVRRVTCAARRAGNGSGIVTFNSCRPRVVLCRGWRLRRRSIGDARVLQRPAQQFLCRCERWSGKTAALSRPWWKAAAWATPCEVALGAPEAIGRIEIARLRAGRSCFRHRRCPCAGPVTLAVALVQGFVRCGRVRIRRRASHARGFRLVWSSPLRPRRSCFRHRRCPCAGPLTPVIALVLYQLRIRRRAAFRAPETIGWGGRAQLRPGRSCFRLRRCPRAGPLTPVIALALYQLRTRRRARSPAESPVTIAA